MRKNLKEIKWENCNYGFTCGFINNRKIFSIHYTQGKYKLTCEFFKLKEEYAFNESEEELKKTAALSLNNWLNNFYEKR